MIKYISHETTYDLDEVLKERNNFEERYVRLSNFLRSVEHELTEIKELVPTVDVSNTGTYYDKCVFSMINSKLENLISTLKGTLK